MHHHERRRFLEAIAGIGAAGLTLARGASAMTNPQSPSTSVGASRIPNPESRIPTGSIKALVFDAYGTLFDVYSVTSLCEQLFPGNGMALAVMWRTKQLQYSLLRSMMNRYKDFWQVTQDGLVYSAHALKLDLTADKRTRLMDAYMTLAAFPDVKPGLQQLKSMGLHLAVLSRIAHDNETKAYVARRLAEGKTKPEIRRCIKRHLARRLYRAMQALPDQT